jgi:hypothetical protein
MPQRLKQFQILTGEIQKHNRNEYCLSMTGTDESRLLKFIWSTAAQINARPQIGNSINEVIRQNLKGIACIVAKLVTRLPSSYKVDLADLKPLLHRVKGHETVLI